MLGPTIPETSGCTGLIRCIRTHCAQIERLGSGDRSKALSEAMPQVHCTPPEWAGRFILQEGYRRTTGVSATQASPLDSLSNASVRDRNMKTYQQVLQELGDEQNPCLLLANGFSQAWSPQVFNYANLLEKADFGASSDVLRSLFAHFETFDFEKVMHQLLGAEAVTKAYGAAEALTQKIQEDQQVLEDTLIATIGATHPSRPNEVSADQFTAARTFVARYGSVYSLNYDLLLYWARNQELPPEGFTSDDGFRAERKWAPDDSHQNVFFLHGGLHLYDTGDSIRKLAFKGSGESIIDQVRDNLAEGRFPLFVSEPTADKKKARIERNPYLSYGFRSLAEIDSSLVVFGHSVHENDKHIFDQVKRSGAGRIYVSLFGDENSPANVRTRANAAAFLMKPGRTVEFFSAESTPVWQLV